MARISFDGLDQLQNELKKLEKAAERLNGKTEVSFEELFTESFMRKHTNYSSIDEFFEAGGFRIRSNDDLDAIPELTLDAYVSKTTSFRSFQDMLDEAGEQYVLSQLGS